MLKLKKYKTIRIPIRNPIDIYDIETFKVENWEHDPYTDRLELESVLRDEEPQFSGDVQLQIFGFTRIQSLIVAFKAMGYSSEEIMEILGIHNKRYYIEYGTMRKAHKKEKISIKRR